MVTVLYMKRKYKIRGKPYVFRFPHSKHYWFSDAHNLKALYKDIQDQQSLYRVALNLVPTYIEHEPPQEAQ